jgi:hypothetical protein
MSAEDTIFDFNKMTIKPVHRYVNIEVYNTVDFSYKETIDIDNEEEAQLVFLIVKEYIIKNECSSSPELIFEVGVCENPKCVEECNPNYAYAPETCKHRLAGFNYCEDYTYIECYSGRSYKIKIVL